jgi:hypothetical protein
MAHFGFWFVQTPELLVGANFLRVIAAKEQLSNFERTKGVFVGPILRQNVLLHLATKAFDLTKLVLVLRG